MPHWQTRETDRTSKLVLREERQTHTGGMLPMCILLSRHRPAADGVLCRRHGPRSGISVRDGRSTRVTRLRTRKRSISQAPNYQTLGLAARLGEGPGVRAADGRLRGPGRPRREGAARGAASACPAATVILSGEGELAEEEKEHED